MSDLMAAIGRVQLTRIEEFSEKRRAVAKSYVRAFKTTSPITLLEVDYDQVVPHIFPFLVPAALRDNLRAFLQENSIQSGIHDKPNHLLSYYADSSSGVGSLPVAEQFYEELVTLPLHPLLTEEDQERVIQATLSFLSKEQ